MTKTNTWRGKTSSVRYRCPNCGKKGMGGYKATPYRDQQGLPIITRECRYCRHVQRDEQTSR